MSEQRSIGNVPSFELKHRLALAMEDAGLKPEDMASEIGRVVTTIRNYLSGRTTPTRAVITAWAMRCGVDRYWLSTGNERGPDTTGTQEDALIRWLHGRVVDLGTRRSRPEPLAA